jgi:hypothetical protein
MKRANFSHIFPVAASAICLFLDSCVPGNVIPDPYTVNESRQKENIYYVPSAPNAPLLSEKNDLNFNAVSTTGSKFRGVEIQSAFLLSNHIGITGSYSYAANESKMKYNRFELGSGYITKLNRGWHFETYAGLGTGKISNWHHTGSSKLNLTHFFLQPAVSVSNQKKTVQLGIISRFEGVNFKVADTLFNTEREPFSAAQLTSLYDKPFHIMWQPGLIFRFGWKNFKFHAGYSISADLTNPDLYRVKENFSFGLGLQFNNHEKKTPK